ncbi:MAG: hypothetical protein Q4C61_09455 [Lachnospiraceae bacterium]|nr:hypothetical protein [Lachnospiraceae bacterium]
MKKGLKKAAVFGLGASLALTSLAGCSKKEKFDTEAAAITVNDDTVSAGVVNFAVRYNQAGYESLYMSLGLTDPFSQDLYGYGTTLGDDVKSQLATQLSHALLAEQKMGDYDVSLSDEDKEKISAAAAAFVAANDAEVLENIGITQASVERYLELTVIQDRVEAGMSADVDTEVSDEEAAQRKIQYVLFTPESETEESETEEGSEAETAEETTEASKTDAAEETEEETAGETKEDAAAETESETAVLTENGTTKTQAAQETETEAADTKAEETEEVTEAADTEETEEVSEAADTEADTEEETETETEDPETAAAKERARVHAEELLEKLQAGEAFEDAAEEVGKTVNTTTFGSDYSITELVEATDGLADDTLIETPVETANGYYVVKLVSQLDRDATDNKKETIVNQRKQERISELYTEWEEAGEVSVDSEVMATITFDYHLVQPTEAETDTAQTESAEIETESETGAAETEEEVSETETEAVETEVLTEASETEAAESETAEE